MKTNMQFKGLTVLAALCMILSSFALKPGAHSCQVYLDDKLLVDQYMVNRTIARKIIIDPAENHKQFTLKYNECGRTVTGRVIIIKDENDKVLKEFKFDGSTKGYEDPMTCSVKDLVALKQTSGNLKVYYASNDFPEGQHVASLVIGPGTNTALN
ncbi:MAG TPA: hypothetical protein VK508_03455 [Cyclobacteriaceae bacterium]|nr:hypothetical protein [Cyclobacteriaceae bacterium]